MTLAALDSLSNLFIPFNILQPATNKRFFDKQVCSYKNFTTTHKPIQQTPPLIQERGRGKERTTRLPVGVNMAIWQFIHGLNK